MRKLETLFKGFINAPIQIFSDNGVFKKGLYDLTLVYDNTVSGDLVIVKGNHNIGNNSIQLKDGVNWEFKGNPTISSDSVNGTFIDGGNAITTHWSGSVNVVNTLNGSKRFSIISNSYIHGYSLKVILKTTITSGVPVVDSLIHSDLGNTFSVVGSGSYWSFTSELNQLPSGFNPREVSVIGMDDSDGLLFTILVQPTPTSQTTWNCFSYKNNLAANIAEGTCKIEVIYNTDKQ